MAFDDMELMSSYQNINFSRRWRGPPEVHVTWPGTFTVHACYFGVGIYRVV